MRRYLQPKASTRIEAITKQLMNLFIQARTKLQKAKQNIFTSSAQRTVSHTSCMKSATSTTLDNGNKWGTSKPVKWAWLIPPNSDQQKAWNCICTSCMSILPDCWDLLTDWITKLFIELQNYFNSWIFSWYIVF